MTPNNLLNQNNYAQKTKSKPTIVNPVIEYYKKELSIQDLIAPQDFEVDFDFISHNLYIRTSNNQLKTISLMTRSVADFYNEFMQALKNLDIEVSINSIPA